MKYALEVNYMPSSENTRRYSYSFMGKEVVVYLGCGYARIEAERKTEYTFRKIATGKAIIFSDAIKKTMLLHYLVYSKALPMQQFSIWKGKRKKAYSSGDPDFSMVYSLGGNKLEPAFPNVWQDEETLFTILSTKKENQDSRFCSLVAIICAKSTCYEAERFIHLWMAFNGMYGFFSNLVKQSHNKKGKKLNIREGERLKWFLNANNLGNEHINRTNSNKIGTQITQLLKNYPIDSINWNYLSNHPTGIQLSNKIISTIEQIIERKYETTAYGYLLVDYAYYFRCNLIHASRPLPLFCYSNEHELKCLRMVNRLLEGYIEDNLCLWFKSSYIDDDLEPLANTISSNNS